MPAEIEPAVPNAVASWHTQIVRRRRGLPGPANPAGGGVADPVVVAPTLARRDLDDLVDKIADRLEQRVVEELERRGRRAMPDVF